MVPETGELYVVAVAAVEGLCGEGLPILSWFGRRSLVRHPLEFLSQLDLGDLLSLCASNPG